MARWTRGLRIAKDHDELAQIEAEVRADAVAHGPLAGADEFHVGARRAQAELAPRRTAWRRDDEWTVASPSVRGIVVTPASRRAKSSPPSHASSSDSATLTVTAAESRCQGFHGRVSGVYRRMKTCASVGGSSSTSPGSLHSASTASSPIIPASRSRLTLS